MIYAGDDEVALGAHLSWNRKNRVLSLKQDKHVEHMRCIRWLDLQQGRVITLVVPEWRLKIQGRLDEEEDQFILFLNGESIYEYDRIIKTEQDEADGDASKHSKMISAAIFKINQREVLESTEKSLRALQATIERTVN